MSRFRVTVVAPADRREQFPRGSRILQDLAGQLAVRLDPQHPLPGIHRDELGRAYFELSTEEVDRVEQILEAGGRAGYTRLTTPDDSLGEPGENCGNIAGPVQPSVCPNRGFHEIAPCPVCGRLHSRTHYEKLSGSLLLCPTLDGGLRHRVRLAFNDPMFNN